MAGRDGRELRVDFIGLLGRLYVVLHLRLERRVGIGRQPLRAQGVLHHVLDDPVGREQLGGGGDVLALDHLADDLVLLIGDVELVEPADDLDIGPVFFGYGVDQLADQRVGFGQVVWQQQLGGVIHRFKEKRHGLMQGVALGEEQLAVEFFIFIAVELEFGN
ncbi:hypothetical protein D3C85_1111090 [compost metagenome]